MKFSPAKSTASPALPASSTLSTADQAARRSRPIGIFPPSELGLLTMKLAVANQCSLSLPPTVLAAGFDLLTPPLLNHIFRGEPLDEPLPELAAAFPADCKNLFFSLHTSSPIEGNHIACVVYGQNRHEIACRGYTRAQATRRADS